MKQIRFSLIISGLLVLSSCGGGNSNGTGGVVSSSGNSQSSTSVVSSNGNNLSSAGVASSIGESQSSTSLPASPGYNKPTMASTVPLTPEGSVNWLDIGVHDPSIVKAGSDYYIFGSHLAAAKSTDLINWEYLSELSANDAVDESPLFNTYSSEISEGIAWSDGYKGNWAADVIKAPNGKYWFYYNHCAQVEAQDAQGVGGGCWNRSYLGLAESDSVEGPYIDKGVFLRSGYRTPEEFTAYPIDSGQTTWNGAVDPNVIDPAAFYDKDNNLWMVYGSYSGGIFVLAMDESTGKPKAGQGFGKHLVGGNFRPVEGAFAIYSPVADYYYLFYSVAGFAANGGYNIRIARSKTPAGPYLDPAGNDIAGLTSTLELGGKLMGGFEFTKELGETANAWGYLSPGHNSAYYDATTGRHILVTHTRFPADATDYPGSAEAHAVRVHEMFVSKDGWLVASPQRFVPLIGDNNVDIAELPGHYKSVNQGAAVNTTAIKSGFISLLADGTVTGSESGTWVSPDGDAITLTLNSGTYVGVVKWQWDNGLKELVPVFSAMSTKGETLWGSRSDPLSATATALDAVTTALDIKTELTIADDGYSLPTVGRDGVTINWVSSNEYFIGNDGSVFIPTPDLGNQTITLTATLALAGQVTTKSFDVTLIARPAFVNAVAHYNFDNALTDVMGNLSAARTTDNNLSNVNATAPSYAAGYSGQAFSFTGANGVRLPDDIIKSSAYTVSFWMNASALSAYTPAFFMSTLQPDQWVSYIPDRASHFTTTGLLWSKYIATGTTVEDWNQVVHTAATPLNAWQHVTITYAEGIMRLFIDGKLSGSMSRPDMFNATGGNFALGVNYGWDAPFVGQIDEFIVYNYALSNLDINGAAMHNLTDPALFPGFVKDGLVLGDLSAVRENFDLLRVGPFVSGISWTSSDDSVLKPTNGVAVINRPSAAEGDKTITLTAHIHYQGFTDTKDFIVTVKSVANAEYSFEGDLSAFNGVAAAGTVTGNRIGSTGGAVDYVAGVKGLAVNLDGTSGVRLPDNLITTNNYTISLWLKPTVFSSYSTAFFGGASADAWLSVIPSAGGTDKTRVWANMTAFYDNAELSNRIPAGQWTHLVVMVNSDNSDSIKLYVNGVQQLEASGFPRVMKVAGGTNEFALGVNYWDTPFNGAIDELKIFSGTISSEKVTALYQDGVIPNL